MLGRNKRRRKIFQEIGYLVNGEWNHRTLYLCFMGILIIVLASCACGPGTRVIAGRSLLEAAKQNNMELVRKALTQNPANFHKDKAIAIAIKNDNDELFHLILGKGVKNPGNALLAAVEANDRDKASLLFDKGVDLKGMGISRKLVVACAEHGDEALMRLLINRGVSTKFWYKSHSYSVEDFNGGYVVQGPSDSYKSGTMNLLFLALEKNNPGVASTLIDAGVNPNELAVVHSELIDAEHIDIDILNRGWQIYYTTVKTSRGYPSVCTADGIPLGSFTNYKCFRNGNFNAPGKCILYQNVVGTSISYVEDHCLHKIFYPYRPRPQVKNVEMSVLMLAVQQAKNEMVRILIKKGADPMLQNTDGKSAIDFAKQTHNKEISELLQATP